MTIADLAKAAKIGRSTLARLEGFGGLIGHRGSTKNKIEAALRKAGVVFTERGVYLVEED